MNIRERISEHVVVTDNGDIASDADADPSELPMINEGRIKRMHPHMKVEVDEVTAQRHKEVPLTESEQALADALEQPEIPPDEVKLVLDARNVRREELQTKGYTEARINFLLGKEFGALMARLAVKGYDITPYLGTPEDEVRGAEVHILPQRNENAEPELVRERDVRERQAGPDS